MVLVSTPKAGFQAHLTVAIGFSAYQTSIQQFVKHPSGFPPQKFGNFHIRIGFNLAGNHIVWFVRRIRLILSLLVPYVVDLFL
jgi:hypothetical protein